MFSSTAPLASKRGVRDAGLGAPAPRRAASATSRPSSRPQRAADAARFAKQTQEADAARFTKMKQQPPAASMPSGRVVCIAIVDHHDLLLSS